MEFGSAFRLYRQLLKLSECNDKAGIAYGGREIQHASEQSVACIGLTNSPYEEAGFVRRMQPACAENQAWRGLQPG